MDFKVVLTVIVLCWLWTTPERYRSFSTTLVPVTIVLFVMLR